MNKIRIIFLGSPEFAVPSLEALIMCNNFEVVGVITETDKPAGRGKKLDSPAIKIIAEKSGVPIFQPSKIKNLKLKIKNLRPEVAVVVAYGQIIPKEILDIPKFGFINIHPSLLPKYRGPAPIQNTILNGDEKTGITIIKLDEKMDHGPILAQQELEISNLKLQITNKIQFSNNVQNSKLWNYSDLSKELSKLGAELLVEILPDYLSNKIKLIEQNHIKATYTKLIKKSDGLINWDQLPEQINRQVLAYNPWPGTYTIINNERLKICQMHLDRDKIIIDKVQLEGRKPIKWHEFVQGYKKPIFFLDRLL